MFTECCTAAVPHLQRRLRRPAGDQRGRVVHAGEDRVVARAEAVAGERRVAARGPYRGEVTRVVDGEQLLLVGGDRRDDLEPVEHPQRPRQPDRQVEPDRVQRMVAEVVGEVALVPDRARGAVHQRSSAGQRGPAQRRPVFTPVSTQ